jgi:DNA-binding response OmpR family regulator
MQKRILIIDDDISILEILNDIFTDNGYHVETVTDTSDIFKTVTELAPDLVIIDYLLQEINGGEICAQIKKNQSTANIPVVMMTAFPRVMLSLGTYHCDEFIEKPFNLDYLISRVQYYTETGINC